MEQCRSDKTGRATLFIFGIGAEDDFDSTFVGSVSTLWKDKEGHLVVHRCEELWDGADARGRAEARIADDHESAAVAYSAWLDAVGVGEDLDLAAYKIVCDQKSPYFLEYSGGGFGA